MMQCQKGRLVTHNLKVRFFFPPVNRWCAHLSSSEVQGSQSSHSHWPLLQERAIISRKMRKSLNGRSMAAAVSEWRVNNKWMADGRYLVVLCILMYCESTNCIGICSFFAVRFCRWTVSCEDFPVRWDKNETHMCLAVITFHLSNRAYCLKIY